MVKRGLRAAAGMAARFGRIEAVFQNIEVECAQIFRTESYDVLHGKVEGIARIVIAGQFFLQFARQHQRIAVDFHHIGLRHGIFNRVEVAQIGQQKTQGIAQAAVAFGHPFQDFFGNRQLAAVIGGGSPQAQNIGTKFVIHFLRRNDVAQGFRHFSAVLIDNETVGQKLLVRGPPQGCAACQHGRLEPTPVLVAAFEIQIGRPSQLFALLQNRIMSGTRIKPYIHGVGQFFILLAVFRTEQLAFFQGKPCFDAFFFDALSNSFEQRGRIGMQFARFFVHKERHRRTPKTLAGNHPIGAAFNHGLQTRPAPSRKKLGVVHRLQCLVAQGFAVCSVFVHADKPLTGGAVDQRGFVPPAVGVAVFDFAVGKQAAVFLQPFDNHRVGFPYAHAFHTRRARDIAPLGVDGVNHLDAVFEADKIVFQAVGGRGMYQTGTGLGGDMVTIEHQDIPF